MCFINSQRSELPAKLDEYEISTDFDHVFKFGAVNITSMKRHRWVELFNDKDGMKHVLFVALLVSLLVSFLRRELIHR